MRRTSKQLLADLLLSAVILAAVVAFLVLSSGAGLGELGYGK